MTNKSSSSTVNEMFRELGSFGRELLNAYQEIKEVVAPPTVPLKDFEDVHNQVRELAVQVDVWKRRAEELDNQHQQDEELHKQYQETIQKLILQIVDQNLKIEKFLDVLQKSALSQDKEQIPRWKRIRRYLLETLAALISGTAILGALRDAWVQEVLWPKVTQLPTVVQDVFGEIFSTGTVHDQPGSPLSTPANSTPLLKAFAEQHIERGNRKFWELKYQDAIIEFSIVIELDPDLATAYSGRGDSFYMLRNYQDAMVDIENAIRLDPQLANAYNTRANIWFGQGDYQKAIEGYSQAIAFNSNLANAFHGRGHAYLMLGDYRKAIQNLDQAIKLQSNNARAYDHRATAWWKLNNYEKAIADFTSAKKFNTNPDYDRYAENTIKILQEEL